MLTHFERHKYWHRKAGFTIRLVVPQVQEPVDADRVLMRTGRTTVFSAVAGSWWREPGCKGGADDGTSQHTTDDIRSQRQYAS